MPSAFRPTATAIGERLGSVGCHVGIGFAQMLFGEWGFAVETFHRRECGVRGASFWPLWGAGGRVG